MKNNDRQPEALVRVRQDNSYHTTGNREEAGEILSRYTMFALGIATFSAGFWAIACLTKVMLAEGPLAILKQLTAALMGK